MDTLVFDRHRPAVALRTVARRLLDARVAAGHWEGHLASSALATATAVTAIATAARAGLPVENSAALIRQGVTWLARTQNADGGWGDTPDSVSNISTTALVWAALTFESGDEVRAAEAAAGQWIRRAAGGPEPRHLAEALAARYGKDRTFSVPILTMCAIAGRLGPADTAWRLIPQLPFELATLPQKFYGALQLPVVSYALPALISMGLARHRRGGAIPVVSAVRELAAGRVLRVLDRLQPPNGGFLEAVPLTSFVAMSLVAAGEFKHPAVERGVGFLQQSVRPDGSWPIDTNLATWVTTLAVNALAAGPEWESVSTDERRQIRDWLLGQQYTKEHPYTGAAPGAWAWTNLPGGVPDADDTAGALVALAHVADGDDVSAAAAAGIQWLLDLQNSDGGIPTFCRGWGTLPFDRSSTDLTAHALRAWAAWYPALPEPLRGRVDRATEQGVRFLARAQRSDGAFVPLWFGNQHEPTEENPVFGTSRVLKGLASVSGPGRTDAQRIAALARTYLLQVQNADGGWGGGAGVPSSIEETAVAIGGLAAAGRGADDAVSQAIGRGTAWLDDATEGFCSFRPAPIGLYFARLWYSEDLYPLLFTADALSAVASTNKGLTT